MGLLSQQIQKSHKKSFERHDKECEKSFTKEIKFLVQKLDDKESEISDLKRDLQYALRQVESLKKELRETENF